jgi:N-carbamoyl-L-amino-acid hydrolase
MADSRTVWTIGHIQVEPGSPSVVPGKAEMLLQYRDVDEKLLDELENKIAGLINDFNELSPVDVQIQPAFPRQVCGVMNKTVQKCLAEAAQAHTPDKWLRMPSGAGHDAQIFAPLLPTGMLFIPSIGGISHDIAEDSKEEDIIRGCRALATATDLIFKEETLG